MKPIVSRKFRVKGRRHDPALSHEDRITLEAAQHLDIGADGPKPGCPDEYST
jgi:hypothetical protein